MHQPIPGKGGCKYYINLLVISAVLLCVGLYVVIPAYLSHAYLHPMRALPGDSSPADFHLDFEPVDFTTDDGILLAGWRVPSRNGAAIVAVHGHSGNRTAVLAHAALLAKHGYGVLLFDLRAHGESEGDIFPFGWDADRDIRAGVDYLSANDGVDPDRIGVLGLSAGAGAGLQAAAQDERIKAVVAEGVGFRTMEDMFTVRSLANLTRIPGVWVMETASRLQSGVAPPTPTRELIAQIAPRAVLLIAADTPQERLPNRAYFAAAGQPKALWEPVATGHIAALETHPEAYEREVVGFFDRALQEKPAD